MRVGTRMAAMLSAIVMLASLLAVLTTPQAEAAKQDNFWHGSASQKANMLVYTNYTCKITKTSSDFIPRGGIAEKEVGSIWIPKKTSLWYINTSGDIKRYRSAKPVNRCASLATLSDRPRVWVFRNGQKWDAG